MDKKVMVAISAGVWDGAQHRPHHFMKRAAGDGRTVVYVEPPVTLIAPLKNKQLLKSWKKWYNGMQQHEENLYVLSPPPVLPFGNKYRFINKINQWIISFPIKKASRQFGGVLELYSFLPSSVDLLGKLDFNSVYYDCVDDHASFTGFIKPKLVKELEKELMGVSHVCFATARKLLEDRSEWSTNLHLVPNGAEFEHFSKVQEETLLTPWDIDEIPKPVVGFIGGISDWIDLKLIEETARALPTFSFVMIGPIDTNISNLRGLENVYFLGSKPYKQLPNYLQEFDICLIPFKINELTKSVNPIKMYEYLSAGKPVISTAMPEVEPYQDVIEVVHSGPEMIEKLIWMMDSKEEFHSAEKVNLRQRVGEENSWDARWERVSGLLR
jgi:glycosyltransferase involved in cell wall biosynthesis